VLVTRTPRDLIRATKIHQPLKDELARPLLYVLRRQTSLLGQARAAGERGPPHCGWSLWLPCGPSCEGLQALRKVPNGMWKQT
jgi:hypothetical protein